MAKTKTTYYCQNCGANSPKWIGKCPSCNEWNTYVEEVVTKSSGQSEKEVWQEESTVRNKPKKIQELEFDEQRRLRTGNAELDRTLGGGIVPGSLVLIGGEPGIGKSTLLLQMAIRMPQVKTLYASGEESLDQIRMRAERIGITAENCFLLAETSLANIMTQAAQLKPDLLIIDSIQTLHTEAIEASVGSISQVRECTGKLMKYAKQTNVPVFLIGHVNKDGAIAGPKVLEHMVDTVLQFEGDRHLSYRILRTSKNRFGSTSELGIYEMREAGLREVTNPSEVLISPREGFLSGVGIGATLEGNRPLLIEVQSLVSTATYGTPQRSTTGFDVKRLNMLLAVLEKRLGVRLSTQDIFLNLAGGLKVVDPALDLSICASIYSSFDDVPIPSSICFSAEVGLGGEIRAVNRIESRITEAAKLGFAQIYVSKHNVKGLDLSKFDIEVKAYSRLAEAFEELFN
ncbi:DNA repair protein RadA [Marinoscillum furvescens]|uniref:DNA repair protein RadA n=1 Tax=Marinoscillum furvescens DSM 4134 TaxID=1122208 RepID=A0A3D9L577_MARFU|nr:DNA repair protein RadA [Marinoscillum furvescens]REE00406.1 DNA repair protein RadA/Sms [Marinoscillum furvescens DSM 4134]